MADTPLIRLTERGFYCAAGDFYLDPWLPVRRAVVTHAHGDHLAHGSAAYLIASAGAQVFRTRLGPEAAVETLPYGETTTLNGVRLSFHPAGHILGSAQVRLEYRGEVWVLSSDYKRAPDPTCAPFEIQRCHTFISEATFGLPIYRWPPAETVFEAINAWWRANQERQRPSLLFCYALGKAQRLIAGVDASLGPIYTHGMVERFNEAYRASGVTLPPTVRATEAERPEWGRALIVAPIAARGTPWMRRFGTHSDAFASGWMRIRGTRRRRAVDRGFVISDHVDWPGLLETIAATGAERVGVTHGYVPVVVRWLREQGLDAVSYPARFVGESDSPELEEDTDQP